MDNVFLDATGDAGQRTGLRSFARVVLMAAAAFCFTSIGEARITQLQVVRLETPTFGGMTFGNVGAYEKITARAFGELDPTLPGNALITDIQFAPRNAGGWSNIRWTSSL